MPLAREHRCIELHAPYRSDIVAMIASVSCGIPRPVTALTTISSPLSAMSPLVLTRSTGALVSSATFSATSVTSSSRSPHASTMSAPLRYRSLTSIPIRSTTSLVSRRPAVSTSLMGHCPLSSIASIASRVVPGTSVTIARALPSIALNSDDLPAFGAPAITTRAPSLSISPAGAVASNASSDCDDLSHCAGHALARDRSVIFLRKVDIVRDQRFESDDLTAELVDSPRQPAVELLDRSALHRARSSVNQISHGLGLDQIHLTVEHCSASELSGQCWPGAGAYQRRHYRRGHHESAVSRYLHDVLARVRVRRDEPSHQSLVEHGSIGVEYAAQRRVPGFGRPRRSRACPLLRLPELPRRGPPIRRRVPAR